ncbi:hypothetical protein A2Z33_01640 [Candidatus Gottesmanbacteria bacterium RBG_16_52_11]|uniref:Uncharacterized protein n=1 Tax=Candidatus Gottesmanbacteria bacterium RBG_16_52_11 TaxID=1798374 RepID=A0A1F5YNZ4_9BACT|nr:MAG: hypothetical protein A2Z33_01640 [Candidatus Gottesmanbacteria bacterium RBG_16_52_11]
MKQEGRSFISDFKEGIVRGIGYSFGVTFGFLIISTVVLSVLHALGGVPVIGSWIAVLVESVQQALKNRNF